MTVVLAATRGSAASDDVGVAFDLVLVREDLSLFRNLKESLLTLESLYVTGLVSCFSGRY